MTEPEPVQPESSPEPVWVFDHTDVCGTKYRVRESQRTVFENQHRGTCPTCLNALPQCRPATAEDWEIPAP